MAVVPPSPEDVMIRRVISAAFLVLLVAAAGSLTAQSPTRSIRRDIPMTDAIKRALAAGSRDSTGLPTAKYWQLQVDYSIDARLDPATSRVTGRETITVKNNSPTPLTSIGLRLDQNIFRAQAIRLQPPAEATDGMVISRLSVNGQNATITGAGAGRGGGAPPTTPVVQGVTNTNARVDLPQPLAPGASANVEVEWSFKMAGGVGGQGHRMTARWADTLYQATQWYPRVSVYDDLRGWDPDPYLGPSEFYNNFGRFDVRLDLPAGWLVGATGNLVNEAEVLSPTVRERLSHVLESDEVRTIVGPNEAGAGVTTTAGTNGRVVWHFVADQVNDFAWGTAKQFVWQSTRATIPGGAVVPIHLLYLPGRANLYANAGPITRHALEFYSKQWGIPYPFPKMTLLDGPDTGMEYPMVIMSNQGAADHEAEHSWAPMIISNNETWYGWMDEGFNQYMNILSDADAANRPPNLDGRGQSYGRTSGSETETPMMWDANYGGPGYSFQTYSKTPLMLSMLGGIVGDTAVWRAQREYANAWKFKHPTPWDYMFSMQRSLKQDLGWFWNYWLFTTESVEGSIQSSTTQTGRRTTVRVRQNGGMPSPVVLRVEFDPQGAAIRPMANAKMIDANTYEVTFPVDVWFGGSRTYDAVLDFGTRAIRKITLDPHGRFPDRDPADNVWPRG
jgi:hypothetical protein